MADAFNTMAESLDTLVAQMAAASDEVIVLGHQLNRRPTSWRPPPPSSRRRSPRRRPPPRNSPARQRPSPRPSTGSPPRPPRRATTSNRPKATSRRRPSARWRWPNGSARSAPSSPSSTRSPTRPTCWPSTPPSKRPAPGKAAAGSPSSPTRSAGWPSGRRPRPPTSRRSSRASRPRPTPPSWRWRRAPSRCSLARPAVGGGRRHRQVRLTTQQQRSATSQVVETMEQLTDASRQVSAHSRPDRLGVRRAGRPRQASGRHRRGGDHTLRLMPRRGRDPWDACHVGRVEEQVDDELMVGRRTPKAAAS